MPHVWSGSILQIHSRQKHTVTQPAHATFPSRDHHGLYIPSMLLFKLKGQVRVMNVCLNLPDPTQHVPPMERMSHMPSHPKHHNNLIRDAAISLAQYDLHFWDTDEPIIPLSHHILLNSTPDCTVLVHAITQQSTTSTSWFTITENRTGHILFAHNHDLHLWLEKMIP